MQPVGDERDERALADHEADAAKRLQLLDVRDVEDDARGDKDASRDGVRPGVAVAEQRAPHGRVRERDVLELVGEHALVAAVGVKLLRRAVLAAVAELLLADDGRVLHGVRAERDADLAFQRVHDGAAQEQRGRAERRGAQRVCAHHDGHESERAGHVARPLFLCLLLLLLLRLLLLRAVSRVPRQPWLSSPRSAQCAGWLTVSAVQAS
mmetsp:Transcript_24813/g.70156  ORF Transcript_24813/g.70156 Transcript_24813/m.70156 type:complete len:209 (-) Transcript_24813:209-835(-)